MQSVTRDNFGPLIAYILPGFVTLLGVSFFSPTVQSWLAVSPTFAPTVGGFLYVTLGSTAAGLIVSAVRWATIDTLYHHTGVPEPQWSFSALRDRLAAFETIVEYHYRYFQFYANMLVAISFAYGARLVAVGIDSVQSLWLHVGFVCIWIILLAGSRDALRKYYTRGSDLLHAGPAIRLERVPRRKSASLRTQ